MSPIQTWALLLAAFCLTDAIHGSGCPFRPSTGPTDSDARRAARALPTPQFTASGASQIRRLLNTQLTTGALAMPSSKPCESFSLEQLAQIQLEMSCHTDPALVSLAGGASGLRAPQTNPALARQHAADHADAAADSTGAVAAAVRDARCHGITMSWVHHLAEVGRAAMSNHTLPLLPEKGLEEHSLALENSGIESAGRVLGNLSKAVTCQIGHEADPVARGKWEGFPHWPFEVTYNASGYGPYPFWTLGGGTGGSLTGPGTDIQTWWSAVHNAERLDHASCSLSGLGEGAQDGPCTHLFLNGSWAFVYAKDESFCCMSSAPKQYTPCHLTRPQRNFMDVMKYDGEIEYKSEDGLYDGKAKKYSMHLTTPSNFYFWYVTDMKDRPLEQGEGPCDMYATDGTRNCGGPPKMLFHQYHVDTFKNATVDPAVFALPAVCQKTPYTYCMVQPTNFCDQSSMA